MAYFLWDDQGVLSLVKELESPLADDFTNVFSPVEKVDIFRIMVCKWFGGIVSAEQQAAESWSNPRLTTPVRGH